MTKTNCNIIKDLLPSYMDGICSPESRKLVEEHMAECRTCQKIYEQMQLELISTNTPHTKEVDYFKEIKKNVFRKNAVIHAIIVLLFLLLIYYNMNFHRFFSELPVNINYLFPVAAAGLLFALLPDYAEHEVPTKLKFTILGFEFAAMTYIFLLLLYTIQSILDGKTPFGMEPEQTGPFLSLQIRGLAAVFMITFAVTLFLSIRKKAVCPALHFVPLGGVSLMFEYQRFLSELSTQFGAQAVVKPYLTLAGEVVLLVGIYMLVNRKNN